MKEELQRLLNTATKDKQGIVKKLKGEILTFFRKKKTMELGRLVSFSEKFDKLINESKQADMNNMSTILNFI